MAHVGTAFVDIRPDFSAFGPAFRGKVEAEVKAATAGLGGDIHKTVKVDVDRSGVSRATAGLNNAFKGVGAALGGLLGNLPVIGGLFKGLTSSLGTSALGAGVATAAIAALATVLIGLGASIAVAAAGLGALTLALAGALAPALIVTVGAFVRFAAIIKAVKDHQTNASAESRGLAGAQDQLRGATDAVAQAQGNLKEQTTAAYAAWADSIEAVKDDLLGVKDAQLGITDANLSLREAQQALKDFRKEAGGSGLDAVFKKFTDVNVGTGGLQSALKAATRGHGLSEDQEIKLERLILNVRQAKLNELHATDALGDATRKLGQDRKTESDFARKGISAYKPYTAATAQLASAQRSLASAQRASAAASERQTKVWKDLTPAERKFGLVLIQLGKTFKRIFTPVMAALLPGVTKGLRTFAKAASDPKIVGALTKTGKALGDSFAGFAKLLTTPEMRRLFVRFADAGARIIPKLADAFGNILTVLARIGGVAVGKDGLSGIIDGFDRWTKKLVVTTSNTKELRKNVQHVIDRFKDFASKVRDVVVAIYKVGKFIDQNKTKIEIAAGAWVAYRLAATVAMTAVRWKLIRQFLGVGARGEAAGAAAGTRFSKAFGLKLAKLLPLAGFTIVVAVAFEWAVNKAIAKLLNIPATHTAVGRSFNPAKGVFDDITHGRNPFKPNGGRRGKDVDRNPPTIGKTGVIDIHGQPPFVPARKPSGAPDFTSPPHAPSGRTFRSQVIEHVDINVTTPAGAMPDGRYMAVQAARELAKRR